MAEGEINTREVNDRFKNLGDAANDLAGRFGSLFIGAPKDITSVTDAFSGLVPGLNLANQAIRGFEGYVGVLQSLSQSGVNFGNQIDEMIIQAGAANMQIGDLARVVSESSERIALLGAGANSGVQGFLARQAAFYENVNSGFETRLKRLGLTVDDINDRFLTYDMLSAISNTTDRQVTAERNKRATEFAEEMDRLAKLTGKQADELAAAVEETAREGRVFAAQQLIPEGARTQFASDLTSIGQEYGPIVGNFMKDLVTQGFPSPRDPAMLALNSFAPRLGETFAEYNRLMRAGQTEQANILLDSARVQVDRLRTDENFLNQVRLSGSGASEFLAPLGELSTQLNSSVAVQRSAIVARLRANGEEVTEANIRAERQRAIDEQQERQQRDATSGSAQLYQSYLDSLTELQRVARVTQEMTVRTTFGFIEDGVRQLATNIANLDMDQVMREAVSGVSNFMSDSGLSSSAQNDAVMFDNAAQQLINFASEFTSGNQLGEELLTLAEEMSSLAGDVANQGGIATSDQRSERDAAVRRMAEIVESLSSMPEDQRPRVADEVLEYIRQNGLNDGTLGTTGRLFRNFGQETFAALHGLEAVTTPDQMADIVRSSSAGTMEALVDSFMSNNGSQMSGSIAPVLDNFARTNVSTLNGMLNTVRTQIAQNTTSAPVEIDLTQLEQAIMNLPSRFKQPVEEALNSALKPSMEQVAMNTARGADYGERTFKNTRGMNGDFMRGA